MSNLNTAVMNAKTFSEHHQAEAEPLNAIRQAIVTKFISPTNTKGSRIKATAAAGSVTVNWDYSLNVAMNHHKAAKALATKMEWSTQLYGGGMPDNSGYCWVAVPNT
jgi:hypothetical protein